MPHPLRVGLVQAPTAGLFFVALGADGTPYGVTADLGAAYAARLDRPVEYVLFPASGECTEATHRGDVDVAFMPVDDHRRTRVAFGPAYYRLESTYLVTAASGIHTLDEVDRPGVRIIGVADTTTIRAAARSLLNTSPIAIEGVDHAIAAFRAGKADALALSRDSLAQLAATMPGTRITPGGFQHTTISIAVPPGRPDALADANAFMDAAKADGTIGRAFAAVGLGGEAVA